MAAAAPAPAPAEQQQQRLTVYLDWTPNVIHGGLLVALQKGWFAAAGLDVVLDSPHLDDYKATPAGKLAAAASDADGGAPLALAVVPSESVLSHATWPGGAKPKLVAVATLLQADASAIVTLASSGIDRPAKLDGKTYASYGARYEGRIVQSMIRHDGGAGEFVEATPPMLECFEELLAKKADATWVFLPVEGVKAERAGVELHAFRPEDYGVAAYGYSPVLAALPATLERHGAQVRAFLAAAAKGYAHAARRPADAAAALVEFAAALRPPLPAGVDPTGFAGDAAEAVAPHFFGTAAAATDDADAAAAAWGRMDPQRWEKFVDWLSDNGVLTTKVQSRAGDAATTATLDGLRGGDAGEPVARESVDAAALMTNDYLPA